jgi:hypothetical protein
MSDQVSIQPGEPPRHARTPEEGRGRWWLAAAMTCTVVMAGVFSSLPAGVRNWDNQVKLQVARNVLRGRGPVITERTPADDFYVLVGEDGQRYSGYLPLTYLLQVPTLAMAAMGVLAEGVSSLVLLALMAGALVGWGRSAGVSIPAAVAGAFLVCLATPFWPMTAHGYDNHVDALGLIAILWAGADSKRGPAWLWAGLVVGAALAARLSAVLLLVPAAVLMLGQRPRTGLSVVGSALRFGAGCLPGVVLVLWFNFYRFGSLLVVHTVTQQGTLDQLNEAWFSRQHWLGMAGLTVSFGKGLFWYAPILLAVLGLARPLVRRDRAAMVGLASFAAVAIVIFGRLKFWHGDWAWGPRYVAPLFVAAAPLGWLLWDELAARGRAARAAAATAFLVLVLLQVVPVIGYPIESYFRSTLAPLVAAGRLVTRPVTGPPLPADHGLLYFQLEYSPIVRLARTFWTNLSDPASGAYLRARLAEAALMPMLAFLVLALAARKPKGGRLTGPG